MRLITENKVIYHVSLDTVCEFESTIAAEPDVSPAIKPDKFCLKSTYLLHRLLRRFGLSAIFSVKNNAIPLLNKEPHFIIMMGLNIEKYKPYAFFNAGAKNVYLFDAWPCDYEKITTFVDTFKINTLFISASASVIALRNLIQKTDIHWIPEGINPKEYKYYPYNEKSIDILALGRKYDAYHDKIVSFCKTSGKSYFYERKKGTILFPSRAEFIDGMARAKVSICVPSSITHPNRSGDVETMTIRYLQSMVSKCLVVGHAPEELIRLFGYNPVIEIDLLNSAKQIEDILVNFHSYIPLIERNYEEVISNNTWQHRWSQINEILNRRSFTVDA